MLPNTKNRLKPNAKKTRHHRSVSLERDHAALAPTRPFLVTGCANRAIGRILDGWLTSSGTRAWTLTGPFGTGKSSFGLFLSRLLERPVSTASRDAKQILLRADRNLHTTLQTALPRAAGLTSVIVTGARKPLSNALARAFAVALSASTAQVRHAWRKNFARLTGVRRTSR